MAALGNWLDRVVRQIEQAEGRLTPSDWRRLKLALLLRSARRVAAYSAECATCHALQGHIEDTAALLAAPGRPDQMDLSTQLASVTEVARHLRLAHGLVVEQHYVTRFVIGGLVLVNYGITVLTLGVTLPALATRVAFSYTVGRLLDRRAKRRGRVL
jgi:hypothetical protein